MANFTPQQQTIIADRVAQIYADLNDEILGLIGKRLNTRGIENITRDSVFEWQLDKLNQVGGLHQDSIKALRKATGLAQKRIREVIEEVGYKTLKATDSDIQQALKRQIGTTGTPSSYIDEVIDSYVNQTFREFDNFINQSLITTSLGAGSVTKMYEDIISRTTSQVLAGVTTVQQALRKTVMEWVDSGVPSGFVDKGGNLWSLERYARTSIRSTVNRTYNELRMSRMEEFDLDLVRVSELPDPREICSHIQGRVATLKPIAENDTDYPSIYEFGYGTPGGIRGVNCRHMFFPYVEGVNELPERKYSEKEMAQNREQAKRQTALESQIRKAKRKQMVAKQLGDEELAEHYRKQVRDRQAAMRAFIAETGRGRRYGREQVYGLGSGRPSITSTASKPVIRAEDYSIDRSPFGASTREDYLKQKEWILNELDVDKYYSFEHYTGSDYSDVNYYLRTGKHQSYLSEHGEMDVEGLVWDMKDAFKEAQSSKIATLQNNIRTFRGIDKQSIGDVLGKDIGEAYRDFEQTGDVGYIKRLLEGRSYKDKGFTSTSRNPEIAKTFAGSDGGIRIEYLLPKGYNKGLFIEDASLHPEELEFLIQDNSEFVIHEVLKSDNGLVIRLVPK